MTSQQQHPTNSHRTYITSNLFFFSLTFGTIVFFIIISLCPSSARARVCVYVSAFFSFVRSFFLCITTKAIETKTWSQKHKIILAMAVLCFAVYFSPSLWIQSRYLRSHWSNANSSAFHAVGNGNSASEKIHIFTIVIRMYMLSINMYMIANMKQASEF